MKDSSNNFPTIGRRIISDLIDCFFVFVLFVLISKIVYSKANQNYNPREVYLLFIIIILLYFPLLNSYFYTFGQGITQIRMVSLEFKKLTLTQSVTRFSAKVYIGWISFFLLFFSLKNRSIHDFLGESIILSHHQLMDEECRSDLIFEISNKKIKNFFCYQVFRYVFLCLYFITLGALVISLINLRINKL